MCLCNFFQKALKKSFFGFAIWIIIYLVGRSSGQNVLGIRVERETVDLGRVSLDDLGWLSSISSGSGVPKHELLVVTDRSEDGVM